MKKAMMKKKKPKSPKINRKLFKGFLVSALLGQQHVVKLVGDVADQPVEEKDQATIEAIKDAAWHSMMEAGISKDNYFTMVGSCVLAAYELGRNGKHLPLKSRK